MVLSARHICYKYRMQEKPNILIALILTVTSAGIAQGAAAQEAGSVAIAILDAAPVIDGTVDASEWSGAAVVDEYFVQIEPEFGAPSPFRTVVRIGLATGVPPTSFAPMRLPRNRMVE